MTELEAVEHLQYMIDQYLMVPHTHWIGVSADDREWAWVRWSCWQARVGLGYNMPDLASIRVLRVYRLFYLLGGRGGADFDLQVGYSGRSERVKILVEGIGMNTCGISLFRWVNGRRRRIGERVVGVLVQPSDSGYSVENLSTMPATAH
jgi:hypothetical protein